MCFRKIATRFDPTWSLSANFYTFYTPDNDQIGPKHVAILQEQKFWLCNKHSGA